MKKRTYERYLVWYTVLDTSGDNGDVELTDTAEVYARSEREAVDMATRKVETKNAADGYPFWIDGVAHAPVPWITAATMPVNRFS